MKVVYYRDNGDGTFKRLHEQICNPYNRTYIGNFTFVMGNIKEKITQIML